MRSSTNAILTALLGAACTTSVVALDNGFRVPPMGWSSWYGFTSNINDGMIRGMADGLTSSGLAAAGYTSIWIDDGWVIGRENASGTCGPIGPIGAKTDSCKPIVDPKLFPFGMANLTAYIHSKGLKFGIYTSKGVKTCLGYQPTQPNRPGSCGYETVDANTYVHDWDVDAVKDDGCGSCAINPWYSMRDALNATGKHVFLAVHAGNCDPRAPGADPVVCVNGTSANMWRTGGDLSSQSYSMWTNRLDLATTPLQYSLAGPGAFPNPDFLEVGYSPRNTKARMGMSVLEQRAMFTLWAALPAPLMLSADVRPAATAAGGCGGVDADALATLANPEVIAVNQDPRGLPMKAVRRGDGVEIYAKPLTGTTTPTSEKFALVLWYRNVSLVAGQRLSANPPSTTTATATATASGSTADTTADPATVHFTVALKAGGKSLAPTITDPSLCLGKVGVCACANPTTTPRLGLVKCDVNDVTQLWSYSAQNKILSSEGVAGHVLNGGPTCASETGNSLLLYPGPHNPVETNEEWQYNPTTGVISTQEGNLIGLSAGSTSAKTR